MSNFNAYSVLVTENCNLACKYCYEVMSTGHKKNNMSEEVALKTLDFMFDQLGPEDKDLSICFFGGEPTLMPNIIDLMCTEGKKLAVKNNKNLSASIITNATNMNKQLYNTFKKHLNIWGSTQLSVDGPNDIQDAYRVFKNGAGSFDKIESNLVYWKELFGRTLNVHGVLNKNSIGRLYESFIYFREKWEIEKIWFIPAKDDAFTPDDVDIYERELKKIYEYVMKDVRENKRLNEVEFYAPLDRALRDGKMGKPCGAGANYCTITAKGDIWPCHHLYFVDEKRDLYLGNVFDGVDLNKKRIWDEYDGDDLVGCEDCEHPSCYRCIAENYEKYGTPFTQIKGLHCGFMKVDLKYQKLIREELEAMGLINKKEKECGDCLGNARDCVGKVGDCPKVVSVDECVFDRGDCTQFKSPPKEFEEVGSKDDETCEDTTTKEDKCCGTDCCSNKGDNVMKDMIDDIIKVLVKYHNNL